jgi:hypothetical protein
MPYREILISRSGEPFTHVQPTSGGPTPSLPSPLGKWQLAQLFSYNCLPSANLGSRDWPHPVHGNRLPNVSAKAHTMFARFGIP